MPCSICGGQSTPFGRATILGKYDIGYFRCVACGFIETEEPYWLEEAYATPITRTDIGLVARNIVLSKVASGIITALFNWDGKFVDHGGGYGLFVRLMRDRGFDFYRYDKFCENLFASNFDASAQDERYEVLTAFEVFEHLNKPLETIEKMLSLSTNILFTTEIVPMGNPRPSEWWYYGLDHGQHISFYTHDSLRVIAKRTGLNLYTNGTSIHLFTRKRLPPAIFRFLARPRVASALAAIFRRNSLLEEDYRQITGKELTRPSDRSC